MKKFCLIAAALITALTAYGCATVNLSGQFGNVSGSGDIITVEYPCGDFTGLEIELAARLVYTAEESDTVKIEMYENLAEYINVTNKNGVLLINSTVGIMATNTNKMPVIYVSAPTLESLKLGGMLETLQFDEISTDKFTLDVSGTASCSFRLDVHEVEVHLGGAGDIALSGVADKAYFITEGVGTIEAFGLETKEAYAEVSGVGGIEVNCSEKLDAVVMGLGSVEYKGRPIVNKEIDGLGRVENVD